MSEDWSQREQDARQKLAVLSFLVGDWVGEGASGGQPLRGELRASLRLDATFLEVRETLRLPDGTLDHEDICFYRYDAHNEQLRVLQMVAPAWTAERPVVPLEGGGLRWFDGPLGPQVSIVPEGDDALVVTVRLPDAPAPLVQLRYRRA